MQDAAKLQYLIGPPTKRDGTWRLSLSDLFVLRGTELKRERYNRQASLSPPNPYWGVAFWAAHRRLPQIRHSAPVSFSFLPVSDAKRLCRAMPLSVQGGLSPEEAQLLGAGMHVYKDPRQETVNIYNELEAHDSSCCGPMFGLSTGATHISASLVRSVARPRLVSCNLEAESKKLA